MPSVCTNVLIMHIRYASNATLVVIEPTEFVYGLTSISSDAVNVIILPFYMLCLRDRDFRMVMTVNLLLKCFMTLLFSNNFKYA